MGQYADQCLPPVWGNSFQQSRREFHGQQEVPSGFGKASPGLRVAVGIGGVGLDVENRGSVH